MSRYVKTGGFSQRCKNFFALKGVVQPRCSDSSCWEHYFRKNPSKVAAAALALRRFGPNPIIVVQGAEYAMEVAARETFELQQGVRKNRSNYAEIRRARGKRYLKHLVQWLQANPITEREAELASEPNEYTSVVGGDVMSEAVAA